MMYRVKNSKYAMFGGVCAGISHKTKIALWVVRLLVLICFLLQPWMLLVYVGMWAFLPVRHMTDQQFKVEDVTFKDIPSMKESVQDIEDNPNMEDSPKIKVNVVQDLENRIAKEVAKKEGAAK